MVESTSKQLVVITGISGFIGLHVLHDFLKDGSFAVRGTIRGKTEAKIKPIREAVGEALFAQLEIVEADLLDAESLGRAIEGATFVVHTASPFPLKKPKDADVLVKPAVEGTIAVCKACHAHKVKRLVITSSCAAVMDRKPEERLAKYTEENWSDVEYQRVTSPYSLSKTLAEKAAWNFVGSLPEGERFEMVTILPSLVVGKPLHVHTDFTSGEIVTKLFTGEFPVMNIKFPIVRVEDVALAHLKAITVPEAAGKRFVLNSESLWVREIAQSMANEFNPQGFRVKTGEMSYALVWVISIFMRELNIVLSQWGQQLEVDHSQTERVLGIEFRSVLEGINEMVYSLIDAGIIPDKRAKK